jgi:hypothetical protein
MNKFLERFYNVSHVWCLINQYLFIYLHIQKDSKIYSSDANPYDRIMEFIIRQVEQYD